MKRLISTMEVFAGLSFKRMMAVLGGMAVVELILFWIFGLSRQVYTFENAFKNSFIPVVFGIAYAAVFWALAWTSGKSSREQYTMQRLSVSERAMIAVQFVYYLLCFILFVLVQMMLLLIMAKLFESGRFFSEGPQGIFVDFRINSFLHRLFPMWGILPHVNNALCILCSAIAAVNMNVLLRHGKVPISAVILAAITGLFWSGTDGSYVTVFEVAPLIDIWLIFIVAYTVWKTFSETHKGRSIEDRAWD